MPDALRIEGVPEVLAVLHAYQSAARDHASTRGWEVSADAVYAAGIETGFRKNGRVARRLGGLHFMQRAMQTVTQSPQTSVLLTQGLPDDPNQLRGLRQRLANDVARRAKQSLTPFPYSPTTQVHTGKLVESIRVHREGEGQTLIAPLVRASGRYGRRG